MLDTAQLNAVWGLNVGRIRLATVLVRMALCLAIIGVHGCGGGKAIDLCEQFQIRESLLEELRLTILGQLENAGVVAIDIGDGLTAREERMLRIEYLDGHIVSTRVTQSDVALPGSRTTGRAAALLLQLGAKAVAFVEVDGLDGHRVWGNGLVLYVDVTSDGGSLEGTSGYMWVEKGTPDRHRHGDFVSAPGIGNWYCRN